MKFLPQLYLYLFSALCFVIPFSDFGEAIPNILLAATGATFFFVIKKDDFKRLRNLSFYLFIGMIILLSTQTLILNRWDDLDIVIRLLIAPAVVLLSLPLKKLKIPIYSFLAGALTLVSFAMLNIIRVYLQDGTFDFAGYEVNEIILGERPYLGFVCVIAFCLSIYKGISLWRKNKKQGVFFFIIASLFLGFIFIISARISLLSIGLIVFFYLLTLKNKIFRYGLLMGTIAVFCGIFMINKDIQKRFFITENSYTLEEMLKFEPRYHIWNCSFILIKEKPHFGWGFVNGQDKLQECYSKSSNFIDKNQQNYYVRSRFNTHNQFFNFFLSEGWLSLFLFITFFGVCFYKFRKAATATALLIGLFLFCCVENVLSRQMGVMLFGFVWIVCDYLALKAKESSINPNSED